MVIRVIIDGEKIVYVNNEQQPLIRNQRTMVPVHSVFEKLGFKVVWIPGAGYNPKGRLRINNNRYHIVINEDEETFTINGRTYYHPHGVPAQIIGGRVMILLRELLEQTGHWVGWDSSTHTVYIYTVLSGYFKIKNADGKYLTYVGKSNNPITVESANDAATQIWKIERSSEGSKYHIRPAKFDALAMNVYRKENYPCTIQPTAGDIEDTSFSIGRVQDLNCTVNWGGTHYLTESSDKAYWTETDTPQEWTLEPTSYTPPEPSIPSEYSRIRYGSTSGSNYENVVYDKGYGFNLENLKFKQKNDWTGIPLEYAGTSMKFALEQGYSCVLYSYAMVLYALGATVTKYDYRTNKIEEIVADPYSCLMANIGAEGDWSEAQSGEITINEGYFYDNPSKSPVNVAPYRITGTFNKSYDQVNLNRSGTVEAARENAEVITAVLAEHPEGVIVRNGKNSHSFVVVGSTFDFSENYTTVDEIDSCFTVYDSAGVNGGGPEGGIKFETSWSYSDGCRFSNLFRYDIIV